MSSAEQDNAIKEARSYDEVFSPVKHVFNESSYVVANLETTISGQEFGYTHEPASFNTPEDILPAIKGIGVNLVTNANNHILDRGVEGMLKTIDSLNRYNIEHTGCYKTKDESDKIFIKSFCGLRVAFLSFTYGTNSEFNGHTLPSDETFLIDLLKRQPELGHVGFQTRHNFTIKVENRFQGKALRLLKKAEKLYYRFKPYTGGQDIDTVSETEISNPENQPYLQRLKDKVETARSKSDIVVLCLHCGGQYNNEVGIYTHYIYKYLRNLNIDLIVGNHPHCILSCGFWGHRLYTYSLGNFSFTPGGMWYVETVLAEYSVILHAYFDNITKKIIRYTYSIIKNIVDENGMSRVYDTFYLVENEKDIVRKKQLISEILEATRRFSGKRSKKVRKEYLLKAF